MTAALVNFANTTLSSLYFDITKDCLYANSFRSIERKAVVTVLEKVRLSTRTIFQMFLTDNTRQILDTTTSILAPILPHLAEEIHQHLARDQNLHLKSKSFFEKGWKPLVRLSSFPL